MRRTLSLPFGWRVRGAHCVAMKCHKGHAIEHSVEYIMVTVSVLYLNCLQKYSVFCDFRSICVNHVTSQVI